MITFRYKNINQIFVNEVSKMSNREKILLTSLSPTPRPVTYYLNINYATASQSPIALLQLLDQGDLPNKIIILCTAKIAHEQLPIVSKEIINFFKEKNIDFDRDNIQNLSIGDDGNHEELWEILTNILEIIPSNTDLTLDITHSFRHFPFIYFTTAIFMQALRGVVIKGIYYGMFIQDSQTGNILDLSFILDMVEWFYAIRTFKETGQASHLIEMLSDLQNPPTGLVGKEEFKPYGNVKGLLNALTVFNYAYAQALPLEMGIYAAEIEKYLYEMEFTEAMKARIPIPEELIQEIEKFITPFSFGAHTNFNKTSLPLNKSILEQQANVISAYIQQAYIHHAIGIAREWLVSIALMYNQIGSNNNVAWLKYQEFRRNIENQLNALSSIYASEEKVNLSEKQKWLGNTWHAIQNMRNDLAHNGYKENNVLLKENKLKDIEKILNETKARLDNSSYWQLDINRTSNYKKILVSPLGLSKGLLFSAIQHTNPDFLVIITSDKSKGYIDEIMHKSQSTAEYKLIVMKEPFTGFGESEEVIKEVKDILLQGEESIINITGGTTAMQYTVQEIANEVKNTNPGIKTIALVDRRSPEEQRANPYEKGEIIWLDTEKGKKEG